MTKDFPTKKLDKESKCAQKWIKMDLVEWRKCANFATTKFNIMKNPYQHLVFRVVDDLNLTLPHIRKNTILKKKDAKGCQVPSWQPFSIFI